MFEDIEVESEDNEDSCHTVPSGRTAGHSRVMSDSYIGASASVHSVARNYVGELIQSVQYINGIPQFHAEAEAEAEAAGQEDLA